MYLELAVEFLRGRNFIRNSLYFLFETTESKRLLRKLETRYLFSIIFMIREKIKFHSIFYPICWIFWIKIYIYNIFD